MSPHLKYKLQMMLAIAEEIGHCVDDEDEYTAIEEEILDQVQELRRTLQNNMEVLDIEEY